MAWDLNPDVPPDARFITPPVGLPLAVITTGIIFNVFSVLFAGIRTYVRWTDRVFGLDDGLMVAGAIAYTANVFVAIYSHLTGIGTRDINLNVWRAETSMRWHTVWLLVYIVAMTLVKASICITLRRIAETKRILRVTVWVLLIITLVSLVAAFLGTILQCIPFKAHWQPQLVDEGKAKCAPVVIFVALGYIATVCTIITDAALVVVPALLLWKTQMKLQAKLQVFGLLSFASTASLITIVRTPYLQYYDTDHDKHYWIAPIVLFSLIETGVGCMAASFPSLRRFYHRQRGIQTQASASSGANDDIITFGRGGDSNNKQSRSTWRRRTGHDSVDDTLDNQGRTRSFRNPTDLGISLTTVQGRSMTRDEGDWERLEDGDSSHSDDRELVKKAKPRDGGICKQSTYDVEVQPVRSRN